jgi:hypothetical protein
MTIFLLKLTISSSCLHKSVRYKYSWYKELIRHLLTRNSAYKEHTLYDLSKCVGYKYIKKSLLFIVKTKQNFLVTIHKLETKIFGITNLLVDVHQVCSNKSLSSNRPQPRGLWFSLFIFLYCNFFFKKWKSRKVELRYLV